MIGAIVFIVFALVTLTLTLAAKNVGLKAALKVAKEHITELRESRDFWQQLSDEIAEKANEHARDPQ